MSTLFKFVENCTILSSVVTTFSGMPTCWDCYRRKDLSNFPFAFFVVSLLLFINTVVYGTLYANNALLVTGFIGMAVMFFYIGIYFLIIPNKFRATISISVAFVSFVVYHVGALVWTPSMDHFGNLVGIYGCLGCLVCNSLPITEVFDSYKRGDSSAILVPLLTASTINCITWLVYSFLIEDYFLIIPNAVAFVVNALRFAALTLLPKKKLRVD